MHAVIGLGEALITGAAVRYLLRAPARSLRGARFRRSPCAAPAANWGQALLGGLGVALAIAVFLAPFKSEKPDGLEFVGQKLEVIAEDEGPRPGYRPRFPTISFRLPAPIT